MTWKGFLILAICQLAKGDDLPVPDGFSIGVASAAYQAEGGWNADGKGENIWDRLTHTRPELVADGSNGDVACDSYHKWQEDIQNLVDLGVDHYRFSISWSRILPSGLSDQINEAGIDYYNDLINALVENNITPIVTLYHWDLPQPLQDGGGWMNPDVANYFANFSRIAFQNFGDRVKNWITMNEPNNVCITVYENDAGAPTGLQSRGIGCYICGKNLLVAHGRAYRVYEGEFKDQQRGRVGITIDSSAIVPKNPDDDLDVAAADRAYQWGIGWWAHPIFSQEGDYPEVMKTVIAQNSEEEQFHESRLPPFTDEEIQILRGSADFYGMNHYSTWRAYHENYGPDSPPEYNKDKHAGQEQSPDWGFTPWGLRDVLNWVKNQYNNPPIIITETGLPDNGPMQDDRRILYIKEYLQASILARTEDGVNLEGYTQWSLMDLMEWRAGYTTGMGLYAVDFSNPDRPRIPRASASLYQSITSSRIVPDPGV